MDGIVESVLSSYGRAVSEQTREKLFGYIHLLAPAVQTHEELIALGSAYLREISTPDPRYTGW